MTNSNAAWCAARIRARVGSSASAHATDTDFGAEKVRSNPATVFGAFRARPSRVDVLRPADARGPSQRCAGGRVLQHAEHPPQLLLGHHRAGCDAAAGVQAGQPGPRNRPGGVPTCV